MFSLNKIKIMSMVLLLSVFVLTSCNYLDIVPPQAPDFDDTMKDRDATLGFLYSCYTGIPAIYFDWFCQYFGATDEYVEPQLYGHREQFVSYNQMTPSNHTEFGPWTNCYNNLGQCHLFMKYIDVLHPDNVSEADKTRWKAEIKFLEAFYHMQLLNAYGPIPLVDHYIPQNTAKTDFPGRSHYDVCVDSICKWYDDVAEHLPATVSVEELGRATSTACKALKARVLLYAASPLWNGSFPYPNWENTVYETPGRGKELVSRIAVPAKWQKALEACNEAIDLAVNEGKRELFDIASSEVLRNNDQLSLPDYNGADETFRKKVMLMRYLMTTTETEGNKETIFGVITTEVNPMLISIPHGVTLNGSGNPIGGWAGMSPTLYTMSHFFTEDGKLPERDGNFYPKADWLQSAGLSNENIIKLHDKREPRFYAWMSFDGDVYGEVISNGDPLTVNMLSAARLGQGYNPSRYQRDNNQTGFINRKFIQPNIKFRQDGGNNIRMVPFPIIRLAELYLDRAECYANVGNVQKALDDLNVVRKRAGVPLLTTADITTSHTLMDMVREERFVELWGEGHRYYDLRRWMLAPDYLKAGRFEGLNVLEKVNPSFTEFNQIKHIDQPFQWNDRMYMLPIAASEVYNDPNLRQSPGY